MKAARVNSVAVLALIILISFQPSCSIWKHWRERKEAAKKLAWLHTAVPAQDLTSAVLQNDLRFIGVHGECPEVPGVPDEDQELVNTNGIRFLEGTGSGDERMNRSARKYARRYNKLLRAYLHGGHTPSSRAE